MKSALKRLEELVSKSKAGPKLPPTEALELKELKLLKSAAEIAKGRAEIAVAKRKIEDREKYRVGGLAVAAGLSTWTRCGIESRVRHPGGEWQPCLCPSTPWPQVG